MTDPVEVITELIIEIEPGLAVEAVRDAVQRTARQRARQQRLAAALVDEPALLTSARSEGPKTIGALIRRLQELGAVNVVNPACPHCGTQKPLAQRDRQGRGICGSCFNKAHETVGTCTRCGNQRRLTSQDRTGRPLCRQCRPDQNVDHTEVITKHIRCLDPTASPDDLRQLIETVVPQPFQRCKLAWALDDRPDLLTGAGAAGSQRLITLIDALITHGIQSITAPACPFCQQVVTLSNTYNDQRCCPTCYSKHRAQPCTVCGHRRPVGRRTVDGQPLCISCVRKDRAYQQQCSRCGQIRAIARTEAGELICTACGRGHPAICSICGQHKNCYLSTSDKPRCELCSRRLLNTEKCSRCHRDGIVSARTESGEPVCDHCNRKKRKCAHCGRIRHVRGRSAEREPLCTTCYRADPSSFQACTDCGIVERLHHFGLCERCACPSVVRSLLAGPDGVMRPELEPVLEALVASQPRNILSWTQISYVRRLLAGLATATGPVTHEVLDKLAPDTKPTRRLRAVLVNAGQLPPRDEYLADLERWITNKLATVDDVEGRKALRSFATWHHIRRLRAASTRRPLTSTQAGSVRGELSKGIVLLNWLHARGRTLATCTQADIDAWLTDEDGAQARLFVKWASAHRYASRITIPSRRPERVGDVFPIDDHRWTLAAGLLHDKSLRTTDRVAGLLVLLFAQQPTRIARLTTEHVLQTADGVQLLIGAKPLDLPEPLDNLIIELVNNRQGKAVIGHTDGHSWLFPGGLPGQPLTPGWLMARLRTLGIPPRISRNSALMDLAADMPAAVLSQLLGISIQAATHWTHEAGNTRPGYAAELGRRNKLRKF
ncbi:hypothetical protein ACW9HR_38350 [Nocardia gipuzkoensis]